MASMGVVQIEKESRAEGSHKKQHFLDNNECFFLVTYFQKVCILSGKIEIGTVHVLFTGP